MEAVAEVDANFFQVIKLPLISGDPAQVLRPNPKRPSFPSPPLGNISAVSTLVGKTIGIAKAACGPEQVACTEKEPLRITGVMADLPHNTQFADEIFIPHTSVVDRLPQGSKEAWNSLLTASYVRLAPGAAPNDVLTKLNMALDRDVPPRETRTSLPTSKFLQISMTPFTKVHLGNEGRVGSPTPPGSWSTIYGLGDHRSR